MIFLRNVLVTNEEVKQTLVAISGRQFDLLLSFAYLCLCHTY